MPKTPHSVRRSTEPPDLTKLINTNGQVALSMGFRRGGPAQAYVRFRQWCWQNDVNPSELFNALIEPITHFCENFARRDKDNNVIVTFNLGDVKLEKCYGSTAGPKRPQIHKTHKKHTLI